MEKIYTWIESKEVSTNGAPMENSKGVKQSSWEGSKNKHKSHNRFIPYNKGPNHGLLGSLTKTSREILATKKAANSNHPLAWWVKARTEKLLSIATSMETLAMKQTAVENSKSR